MTALELQRLFNHAKSDEKAFTKLKAEALPLVLDELRKSGNTETRRMLTIVEQIQKYQFKKK